MPKTRNIIIFVAIAVALILVYFFFLKPSSTEPNLVTSATSTTLPNVNGSGVTVNIPNGTPLATGDFLTLLLNVKTVKLDDSIFSDPAFSSLRDSSIVLVPDATTGRPNPFAQFGNDTLSVSTVPATPLTSPTNTIPSLVSPTIPTTITAPTTTPTSTQTPASKTPVIPKTP